MSYVLAAIHLNDQPSFQTNEVNDITPHWALAAEFVALNLPEPKMGPQFALGVRGVFLNSRAFGLGTSPS
jgi:hypothetical protein